MQIQLTSNEFWMTPGLSDYVESKIRFAFAALRKRAVSIAVRLRDLNSQAGSPEMMCQISVTMPGQPEILVRNVQENMYAAIDMAIQRAAHRARRIMMCKRSRMLKSVRSKFGIEN